MAFRVWDGRSESDVRDWLSCWSRWPEADVFAHPGYTSLFAGPGIRPVCAAWDAADGAILLPLLLRDIRRELYCVDGPGPIADVLSPYGYGGPFAWGRGERFAGEFWASYDGWARSEGLVSEFIRLSIGQGVLSQYPGERRHHQDNVVRNLTLTEAQLWFDVEHKVRKNVRHARRSGIEVSVVESGHRYGDFASIYRATMDRRRASGGYYFPQSFFEGIHQNLPGQFAYFFALESGRPVSCELVLISRTRADSFLGGTVDSAFPLRPNDLLKYTIIVWAMERGLREFVLGGGYLPDDGIFRYKRSFAPSGCVPFSLGAASFPRSCISR